MGFKEFPKLLKDSNGGCTVYEYDSLKCRFCGSIKILDIINTITYAKCPH